MKPEKSDNSKLCLFIGVFLCAFLLIIWYCLSKKSENYCPLVGQPVHEYYTEGNPKFNPTMPFLSDVNCLCRGKYADKLCVSREGLRQKYEVACDYDTKNYSGVV